MTSRRIVVGEHIGLDHQCNVGALPLANKLNAVMEADIRAADGVRARMVVMPEPSSPAPEARIGPNEPRKPQCVNKSTMAFVSAVRRYLLLNMKRET
jgi:hypothetical protein